MEKKLCSKNCNFNFLEFGNFFSYFWQQRYGRLAKISWCMFRRTSWGEIFLFGKRTIFSSFAEFQQIFFRVLLTNFWQGGQNWILHVHSSILKKYIYFTENSYFFSSFSGSDRKICRFLEKNFCDRCQNCILRCWRIIFDEKMNFVQKNVFSSLFEFGSVFRILANNVTAGMPKYHCACSNEHLQEKYFCLESEQFFHRFRNSSKWFSEFWREFFGRVVTNAFYMYIGTFWGKLCFSKSS